MAKKHEEKVVITDTQVGVIVSRPFPAWSLEWRMAFIQGWKDAYYHWGDDVGEWHPDYDKWPEYLQYAYENGRLNAAQVRACSIPCKMWKNPSDYPEDVNIAMAIARSKLGSPFPQYRANGGT